MAAELSPRTSSGHGWRFGFAQMTRKELQAWWGGRTWWIHGIVWTFLVQGILANSIYQAHGGAPGAEFLSVVMGTFGVFGMIIVAQGLIINELQSGTAAWVLSKPVSRIAFVLSKFLSVGLSYVATLVVFNGAVAYAVLELSGHSVSLFLYAGALAMVIVYLLFFLALSLMVAALTRSRGVVLAVPLFVLLLIMFQNLHLPGLAGALVTSGPSALGLSIHSGSSALLAAAPVTAIYAVLAAAFLAAAIFRFQREEF